MTTKLFKSTVTVSSMTLISRVLGLIRDVVFANLFKVGLGTDAFFVAFRIPNFLRRLFAEGAFSQAFIPVLSEYKTQREHDEVQNLADHVAGTLGGILFIITVVGVVAAPVLVMIFAPGFLNDVAKADLTAQMLRITFPYLLFISLVAFAGGILNSYGRFGVPAFTPVFLNLSLIGAAIWLSPRMEEPVVALAWGVFIAGIVQLLFQLPFLAQIKILPRPRWGWHHEGVRKILLLMMPAIFGSSVVQINLLFDTLIASFLATGSVTWLYYSDRLVEFPLGVFGIALATVILPSLSRQHTESSPEHFTRTLDWALRWVMLIGVPAMVGLFLLAGPLLATLFQHGEFGGDDVNMASLSLMAYALGLPAFILIKVLATGFYARQNTRTPVRVGIIAMLVNMVLNVVIVVPLVKTGYEGPHAGLALATSASAFLQALILYRILRRDDVYQPQTGWPLFLIRILVAAAAMVAVLVLFTGDLAHWLAWGWFERSWHLLMWVSAGAGTYFIVLWILGLRLNKLKAVNV